MNISPEVSVIMPVYNGAKHLAEAIDSILAQSFSNFEFIIIDDASTDATSSILQEYAIKDSRISVLTNEANSKIAVSLNRGIAEASSPLIARMDADDWSHPERLEKQFAFMQANPDVTICGTWMQSYETEEAWKWPCTDKEIKVHLLFNAPIAHPTALLRRNILVNVGSYCVTMPPAEDYDLWARLAIQCNVKFANIPQFLLRYRVYPELDRSSYHANQVHSANMIRCKLLQRLGLIPTAEQMRYHLILGGVEPARKVQDIVFCLAWKCSLLDANEKANFCEQNALKFFLSNALPLMFWCMAREFLIQIWRSVMPKCVRKAYSHLKIMLRKALCLL